MTENEAKWEYCRAIDLIKKIKTEETHERYIDRHKAFDLAIQALEEIQQYKAIGTIEEFKALKEKNEPKKVIKRLDVESRIVYYKCPNCNEIVGTDITKLHSNNCPYCGQSLKEY